MDQVTPLLPGPMSFDELKAFRADVGRWIPAAQAIASSHGVEGAAAQAIAAGSNLIATLNSTVIHKIFPSMLKHQFHSERAVLRFWEEKRLSVPVPRILFEGVRDGWTYLGITRLSGDPGERCWPELTEPQKRALLGRIGRLIAEVHGHPIDRLEPLKPEWSEFLPGQIRACRDRQVRMGLPERFLRGLDAYLEGSEALFPRTFRPVLLTGEYIPENFLCRRVGAEVTISGLIDFGDAMTGFAEYDLIGPGLFLVQGDRQRLAALLDAYGLKPSAALRKRLMLLTLLHRYSHLDRQVGIADWKERAATVEELERLIWPIEG